MKSKTPAVGMEGRDHEVAESEKTQSQLANAPILEEIRQLAYELHLERGCAHGLDLEDWFLAEHELMDKYQARCARPRREGIF